MVCMVVQVQLALGSQLMNIAFLNLVEIPHMKKLYGEV
jgi:hypothetical protein